MWIIKEEFLDIKVSIINQFPKLSIFKIIIKHAVTN